jgi:1-acyl-sn-glycerol-3-phosphate acyltransferase
MRQSKRLLSQGYVLVMFPEGKRSTTACLETAYSGSALIARRTGVPILPVGISGTEKLKGRAWLLSRPEVTMNIGQPFSLPEVNGRLNKEDLVECTEIIMRRIAELLPPEYRGEYGADK